MKHTSCFQVRKGHSEAIGHDLVVEAGMDAPPWLGDGTVVPVVQQQQRVQLQERHPSDCSVFSCAAVSLLSPAELTAV